MDIINLNSKTIFFLNDDIIWNSNFGGFTENHAFNMNKLLNDGELRDLIIGLKIMTNEIYDRYKEFIVPTTGIDTNMKGRESDLGSINIKFEDLLRELEFRPVYYRVSLKSTPDSDGEHAICIVFQKISTSYKIWVGNCGMGGWYHNVKMDDSIYNESILEFDSISKKKLEYFVNFLFLHNTITEFYNVSIPLLLSKSLTFDSKKIYKDLMTNYKHKDDNYFEMQFIGSCSFKSLLFATHVFMTSINDIPRKTAENFFLVCRLFSYRKLLEHINSFDAATTKGFLETNNDHYNLLKTTFHTFYELYSNKTIDYYTDEDSINLLIDTILGLEIEIVFKIKSHNYDYDFTTNQVINNQLNAEKDIDAADPKGAIHTGHFNDFLHEQVKELKIVNEFNKFNYLSENSANYRNHFKNYFFKPFVKKEDIFSTTMTNIISDISGIYDVFSSKNNIFYNFNNNEVLSADFLLFLHVLNDYLYNLNLIEYKYPAEELIKEWNNKYTDMKVLNTRTYEIFKVSYMNLIQNNLLNFITDNNALVNNIFITRGYITPYGSTFDLKPDTPISEFSQFINKKFISKMYISQFANTKESKKNNLVNIIVTHLDNVLQKKKSVNKIFTDIFLDVSWQNDNYFTLVKNYAEGMLNDHITNSEFKDYGPKYSAANTNIINILSIVTDNGETTKPANIGFTEYGIITDDNIHSRIKVNGEIINSKNINEQIPNKSIGNNIQFNLFDNANNVHKENIYKGKGNKQTDYDFNDDILDEICSILVDKYINDILAHINSIRNLKNDEYVCGQIDIPIEVPNPALGEQYHGAAPQGRWLYPQEILSANSSKYSANFEKYEDEIGRITSLHSSQPSVKLSSSPPYDILPKKISSTRRIYTPDEDKSTQIGSFYAYTSLKTIYNNTLKKVQFSDIQRLSFVTSANPKPVNSNCPAPGNVDFNVGTPGVYWVNNANGDNIDLQLETIRSNIMADKPTILQLFKDKYKKSIDRIILNYIYVQMFQKYRLFKSEYDIKIKKNNIPEIIKGFIAEGNGSSYISPKKREYYDSTQYTLPFFINDFIFDAENKIRQFKDINNLIPNIYLLQGTEHLKNSTIPDPENRQIKLAFKSDGMYNEYSDNLLKNFNFVNLNDILEYVQNISLIPIIPDIDKKTELLLLYLIMFSIYNKDSIAQYAPKLNEIKDIMTATLVQKRDSQIKNCFNEIHDDIITKYIEILGIIDSIKNGNSRGIDLLDSMKIDGVLSKTFFNFNKKDLKNLHFTNTISLIEDGLHLQILYDDPSLTKMQTIIGLGQKMKINDYYQNNKEFKKIIDFFNVNKTYKMTFDNGFFLKTIPLIANVNNIKYEYTSIAIKDIGKEVFVYINPITGVERVLPDIGHNYEYINNVPIGASAGIEMYNQGGYTATLCNENGVYTLKIDRNPVIYDLRVKSTTYGKYYTISNYKRVYLKNTIGQLEKVIVANEIGLPPYFLDNFIILENQFHQHLTFIKIDKNFHYELEGSIALGIRTDITFNENKHDCDLLTYNDINYRCFLELNKLDNIDLDSNCIVFKENGSNLIFLYYPFLNILFKCFNDKGINKIHMQFLKSKNPLIKHARDEMFDTLNQMNDNTIYECLNNKENFSYLIGNNQNILLVSDLKNKKNVKILYFVHYSDITSDQAKDLLDNSNYSVEEKKHVFNYIHDKPIIGNVNLYTHPEKESPFYFGPEERTGELINKMEIQKYSLIPNKNLYYGGNKKGTKMILLNCGLKEDINDLTKINISIIEFNNIYEAFQLLYITTLNINYYMSKHAFEYISKTLKMSKLNDFINYINPVNTYFPFIKILYTTIFNIQNEVERSRLFNLIVLNKHVPENLRMKKIYFDEICGNSFKELYQIDYPQKTVLDLQEKTNKRTGFTEIFVPDASGSPNEAIINHNDSFLTNPLYKILKPDDFRNKYENKMQCIVLNFVLRQVDFSKLNHGIIMPRKPNSQGVVINDYLHINLENAQKFIKLSDYEPDEFAEQLEGTLKIAESAKRINFSIVELSNLSKYLLNIEYDDSFFIGANGITREKLTLDLGQGIDINKSTELKKIINYELEDKCKIADNTIQSQIDIYVNNSYRYNIIGDGSVFKGRMYDVLKEKYDNCVEKINEYREYEDLINKKFNILTRTDDIKLTELLFFKTLKEKYEIAIYKLGKNLDGTDNTEPDFKNLVYDVIKNIDDYMIATLPNPGYLYEFIVDKNCYRSKDNFKINTLYIFFDYLMSLQGKSISKKYGGTVMRREQMTLVTDILSSDCNVKCGNKFYQLIMGAGKSSYIAPLLSLLLISTGKYPIHILPEYLVEPGKKNFKILNNFGIRTVNKKIARDKQRDSSYIFDEIDGINDGNLNFLFSDSSVKSILLNVMNKDSMEKYNYLKSKMENAFLIFDEVDDISHPYKCELNYPMSSSKKKIESLGKKVTFLQEFLQLFYVEEIYNIYNDDANKRQIGNNAEKINPLYPFENISIIKKEGFKTLYQYSHKYKISKANMCKLLISRRKQIEDIVNDFIGIASLFVVEDFIDEKIFKDKISISKIAETGIQKDDDIMLNKLDFLYSFFFNVFQTMLTSENRKDFGTVFLDGPNPQKLESLDKNNFVAIPFKGVENPSYTSEFADVNITLAYTVAAYYANKYILREDDVMIIIKKFKKAYENNLTNWFKSLDYKNFVKLVTGITGWSETDRDAKEKFDISKITKEILFNTINHIPFRDYADKTSRKKLLIETFINDEYFINKLTEYVNEYEYQLNATFSDIASSDFCINRTGFSGTPYFLSPIDRTDKKVIQYEPKADPNAEGSIFYSILNKNVKIKLITEKEDIYKILQKNTDGTDNTQIPSIPVTYETSYKTLIDIGAYFVGLSPKDTAKEILQKCPQYNRVVYINEEDLQYYVERQADGSISDGIKVDDKVFISLANNRFIVFYDQKHITGIDVKYMPLDAIGLVLIKNKTNIRDYGQGTYRLRKINITQQSHICIDEKTSNDLEIHLDANNISNDNQDKLSILKLLYNNENNIKNAKIQLQAIHNFRTMFRYHLLSNGINKMIFSTNYPDIAVNIFLVQASKPKINKIDDIGKKIQVIYIEYLEKLYKEFSKIGSNHKLEIKLHELCRLINVSTSQTMIVEAEAEAQVNIERDVVQEKEQEQENIMQNIFQNLYDFPLNPDDQKYLISDLITFLPTDIYKNSLDNKTLIASSQTLVSNAYSPFFIMTKLFKFKYYTLIYDREIYPIADKGVKNPIPEFVFKVIKTSRYDKYIIMTQEEWIQLLSYSTNQKLTNSLSIRYSFNTNNKNFELNKYLPEFITLLNYSTDKPINNSSHLLFILDNLIQNQYDPTDYKSAIFNLVSHIYTIDSYKNKEDNFTSKLTSLMHNFILDKFINITNINYIAHSMYIIKDLNLFNDKGIITDPTSDVHLRMNLIKYFLCAIGQLEFINIIKGDVADIDYTPDRFDNDILQLIKSIINPIDVTIMNKNYINGLLIDTLNVNSGDVMLFETQNFLYKIILNKYLP
jgi:hypothetical protein